MKLIMLISVASILSTYDATGDTITNMDDSTCTTNINFDLSSVVSISGTRYSDTCTYFTWIITIPSTSQFDNNDSNAKKMSKATMTLAFSQISTQSTADLSVTLQIANGDTQFYRLYQQPMAFVGSSATITLQNNRQMMNSSSRFEAIAALLTNSVDNCNYDGLATWAIVAIVLIPFLFLTICCCLLVRCVKHRSKFVASSTVRPTNCPITTNNALATTYVYDQNPPPCYPVVVDKSDQFA